MKKIKILLLALLVVIIGTQMIGCYTENLIFEYLAKPWIMIWIAVFFLLYSKKKSFRWPVMAAFLFCWIGDMLLMLANTHEILFFAGVGGFLFGQVTYIYIFLKYTENNEPAYIRKKPIILLPYLLYLIGILWLLFPVLDGFMRPIILIYGITLIGMSLAAANRKERVSKVVFNRIFWGAVLFVLSDSLIAINKFHTAFDKSQVLIMGTYIAAQLLILSGLVIEKEKELK